MYEDRILKPAADEAAQAASDAHGAEACTAQMAYDFIRTVWEDTEDERAEYLPDEMPANFPALYQAAVVRRSFGC